MTWGLMPASGGSRGSMVRQSKASRRETCPEAGSLMTRGQLDGRCDAGAAEEAKCTAMRSAHWQRLHKRTVSEHHATRGDWKATSGQSARLKTSTEASLTADALSAVGVFPVRSCTQTNRKQALERHRVTHRTALLLGQPCRRAGWQRCKRATRTCSRLSDLWNVRLYLLVLRRTGSGTH